MWIFNVPFRKRIRRTRSRSADGRYGRGLTPDDWSNRGSYLTPSSRSFPTDHDLGILIRFDGPEERIESSAADVVRRGKFACSFRGFSTDALKLWIGWIYRTNKPACLRKNGRFSVDARRPVPLVKRYSALSSKISSVASSATLTVRSLSNRSLNNGSRYDWPLNAPKHPAQPSPERRP